MQGPSDLFSILDCETDNLTDIFYVRRGHCSPVRKGHDLENQFFRLREQQACMGKQGTIGFHLMTAGIKIPTGQDVFGMQHVYKSIPADTGLFGIDLQDDVLVIVPLRFVILNDADAGNPGQRVLVGLRLR